MRETRRGAEEAARRAATAAFASAIGPALEGLASGAAALAAEELPALGARLAERVRGEGARAAEELGGVAAAAEGLRQAADELADGPAGGLEEPLQRAAVRGGETARAAEATAARVREAVDAGAHGLLHGVVGLAERLRLWEQVAHPPPARAFRLFAEGSSYWSARVGRLARASWREETGTRPVRACLSACTRLSCKRRERERQRAREGGRERDESER